MSYFSCFSSTYFFRIIIKVVVVYISRIEYTTKIFVLPCLFYNRSSFTYILNKKFNIRRKILNKKEVKMGKVINVYIGKQLRINLIKKEIKVESLDSNVLRKYIGGGGYRAKLLYDELSTNREFA